MKPSPRMTRLLSDRLFQKMSDSDAAELSKQVAKSSIQNIPEIALQNIFGLRGVFGLEVDVFAEGFHSFWNFVINIPDVNEWVHNACKQFFTEKFVNLARRRARENCTCNDSRYRNSFQYCLDDAFRCEARALAKKHAEADAEKIMELVIVAYEKKIKQRK